jgi:hypothetical protein
MTFFAKFSQNKSPQPPCAAKGKSLACERLANDKFEAAE